MTPQMLDAPVLDPVYEAVIEDLLTERSVGAAQDWCDLTPEVDPPSGDRFGLATVRIY